MGHYDEDYAYDKQQQWERNEPTRKAREKKIQQLCQQYGITKTNLLILVDLLELIKEQKEEC